MRLAPNLPPAALAIALAACNPAAHDAQPGDAHVPGDTSSMQPYDGIAANETLRFLGTEPFWGGSVAGGELTWTTPEDADGETIAVERFAGRGGVSFNGVLGGQDFEMMVTPLACSDGMSDRTYPLTVTVMIGKETRNGCAWSDKRPFEGPERP